MTRTSGARTERLVVGLLTFYVGAGVGWIGAIAGTCTMGDADNLVLGVPALILYLIGVAFLVAASPPLLWLLALAPLAWPYLVQASLSLRLAYGVLIMGQSACTVTHGPPANSPSGKEGMYVVLWVTLMVVPLVGLLLVAIRARRRGA